MTEQAENISQHARRLLIIQTVSVVSNKHSYWVFRCCMFFIRPRGHL